MITFGIDNKYRRKYEAIVSSPDEGADTERHHIIPKSLGGNRKDPANIVRLSYRKHFLANWLLTKFTEGKVRMRMLFALSQMRRGKYRVCSSWQYAKSRQAHKEAMKEYRHSDETRAKIKASHKLRCRSDHPKGGNPLLGTLTKGTKWITNGYLNLRVRGDDIPDGWHRGHSFGTIKSHSMETRLKMSNSHKGKKRPEVGAKLKGRKRSAETNAKIQLGRRGLRCITNGIINKQIRGEVPEGWWLGRTVSEETKAKRRRGRRWMTNGTITKQIGGEVPEGWRLGRGPATWSGTSPKHKAAMRFMNKGRQWITDGTTNKFIYGEIPEGWCIGRVHLSMTKSEKDFLK